MKKGVISQRQEGYVTLRLPSSGRISSEQLRKLADVAGEEGKGFALLTMRKSVELPWIKKESAERVIDELNEVGLKPGSTAREIREVMACAGQERCPFLQLEVDSVGDEIRKKWYGKEMPRKFTITLCGCPNYCSHPYLNDFGIVGRARPRIVIEKCIGCGQCVRLCRGDAGGALTQEGTKTPEIDYDRCIECGWCITNCPTGAMEAEKFGCTITAGGRGGTKPRIATEIIRIASEEEMFKILELAIQYVKEYADGNERLADIMEKRGVEHFMEYALPKSREVNEDD